MNRITNNSIAYAKQRPILIGVFAIFAVIILGAGLAFATGMTNPAFTHADDDGITGADMGDFGGGAGGDIGGGLSPDAGGGDTISDSSGGDAIGSTGSDNLSPTVTDSGTDITDSAPTDIGNGNTPTSQDTDITDQSATDIGVGTNPGDGSTDVGNAPDTSTTESPSDSDDNLSPCCTNDSTTDVGTAPDTSTVESPVDTDTNLAPCCTDTDDTTPQDITTDTPPVVVPVIVEPVPHPVCPTGDSGTYPNCVPPVTPTCPSGTGIYPDCTPTPPTPVTPICNFLTASASLITPGQTVTLTWSTTNAPSISIDHGVGTVTPTAGGSTTVTPAGTTTYTATVPGAAVNTNCSVTVTVTTTPPPTPTAPMCNSLVASASSITSGQTVTLTWSTSNASSVSIDNGVGTVTPTAGGSVTVTPSQTTTYTATVPGAALNPNCAVTVTVTSNVCTSGCGGGGGGGGGGGSSGGGGGGFSGGFSGSGVSGQIIAAPVASYVSLSQIPYTGLDLGPVGTVVYWVALVVFCATASYLVIFTIIPFLYRRITSFGLNVGHVLNQPQTLAHAGSAHGSAHGAAHAAHGAGAHPVAAPAPAPTNSIAHSTLAHAAAAHAPAHAPAPAQPTGYSTDQGFRSFAQNGALTIDDIVKGLAREVGAQHPNSIGAAMTAAATAPAIAAHQEMEMVPVSAPHTNAPAHPIPAAHAPARQPAAAPISTDVRDFVGALLNGDRDTVFGTMRQIVREGGDSEMFLSQVVCAIDDAYRARLDGTKVNPEIAAMTQNCAMPFLERLTAALSNAVDSSYSTGITGSKLALTRALAVVEG